MIFDVRVRASLRVILALEIVSFAAFTREVAGEEQR
jgi:hypothetical protein